MILCLGTTPALTRAMTFDRVALDNVNRATDVRVAAAGKSVNVARVLKTLGEHPTATGFVGGVTGRLILHELSAADIVHDFLLLERPTRVCVTMIDREAGTATELIEEPSFVEANHWQTLKLKMTMLIPRSRALVLSGSLAPGSPTGFNGECARLASEAGVDVIVDARDAALLDTLPHRPTWVKPNRSELASTMGISIPSDAALLAAMGRLIAAGARNVAVTLGGEGAVATDGKRLFKAVAPTVAVVSPIGSGDSFAAGLAAAVARGLDVESSLRLAVACGAANAMTAQAGHLDAGVVQSLVSRIKVMSSEIDASVP